jgi:hypothetical protein
VAILESAQYRSYQLVHVHGPPRDEFLRRAIGVSQRSVQLVIGRLLTDADFRRRVQQDGSAYLIRLRTHGVDLSRAEVAALLEQDPRVWSTLEERCVVNEQV